MPQRTTTDAGPQRFRSRFVRVALVFGLTVAVGCGGYYGFWRYHLKRFTEVAPGVLYRTAQPTELGLRLAAQRYGIRTVVSLQLFDFRLFRGWVDFGEPNGDCESVYVERIGLRHVQWPMGDEQCWPWPDPWEMEEFFRLVDDPDNRPVLIHCMGGRHRTGTMTALYRLEYERRPIEAVLQEMYSYSFGQPIPAQERNLRTYVPRPLPTDAEWPDVAATFGCDASQSAAEAIPVLALRIRKDASSGRLRRALSDAIAQDRPFALALASRVLEDVDDPLISAVIAQARSALERRHDSAREITAAAALLADFGTPADQQFLLGLLESPADCDAAFYEALACGVTNRYTPNRLAFLKPLLADRRVRPNCNGLTYAETAVVRLAAITDGLPLLRWSEGTLVQDGPQAALEWLGGHPEAAALNRLLPPTGRRVALDGDGPRMEDTSKMRR